MTDDLYCSTDGCGDFENNVSKILVDISQLQNKDIDQDARLEALELLDISAVITVSNNALLVANAIDAKATHALRTASTADGKVDGAVSDAANAVIAARDALTDSATALNKAIEAYNAASGAVSVAGYADAKAVSALSASSTAVSDAAAAVITANAADGKADIAVYDSNVAVVKVNKAIITDAQTLTTGQKAQARANIGTLKIEDSNYAYEVIFNILTQTGFMILPIRQSYVLDISKFDPFKGTLIEEGKGYIYVPDNLVAGYKTAWVEYASQIFGLSALTDVPADMFFLGHGTVNLVIKSYPYKPTKIGTRAFRECPNFKTIDLSECTSVGTECFAGSPLEGDIIFKGGSVGFRGFRLTKITSFDCLLYTKFRGKAFSGVITLTKMILRSPIICPADADMFDEGVIPDIYVPDALYDAYLIATNWATYASQIKKISELNE